MPGVIAVGLGWGDEGKGKIVDTLSHDVDFVVRAQGGNNAGHTIKTGENEFALHIIPSGILYPKVRCYIGGGTVIDPQSFLDEVQGLHEANIQTEDRLFISAYAHVIMPYHKLIDKLEEEKKKGLAIGTTCKGIGPCYADKATRVGLRIADIVSPKWLKEKLQIALKEKNELLEKFYNHPPLNFDEIYKEYHDLGKKILPYVRDIEGNLEQELKLEKKVLFEGAQGALLDGTLGTYPYVTSSCTIAGGVCSGAGVGPTQINHTVGIMKAYMTRVGNGPFPTELTVSEKELFPSNKKSREIGVTTGRLRQMGWFDAVITRHAIRINGANSIALTKLDILDQLASIKICVEYELDGKRLCSPPVIAEELDEVIPVYEELPGWLEDTSNISSYEELPENAKKYLKRLEELCHTPISMISYGPERDKILHLIDPFAT